MSRKPICWPSRWQEFIAISACILIVAELALALLVWIVGNWILAWGLFLPIAIFIIYSFLKSGS